MPPLPHSDTSNNKGAPLLNLEAAKRRRGYMLLSQAEVAAAVGVTENTFWRWENGRSVPTIEEAKAWARAIDLPVIELIGENDPKPNPATTDAEPAEAVS